MRLIVTSFVLQNVVDFNANDDMFRVLSRHGLRQTTQRKSVDFFPSFRENFLFARAFISMASAHVWLQMNYVLLRVNFPCADKKSYIYRHRRDYLCLVCLWDVNSHGSSFPSSFTTSVAAKKNRLQMKMKIEEQRQNDDVKINLKWSAEWNGFIAISASEGTFVLLHLIKLHVFVVSVHANRIQFRMFWNRQLMSTTK